MSLLTTSMAAPDLAPAFFGLAGTIVGAAVSAIVGLVVARQDRQGQQTQAEIMEVNVRHRWLLENRARVYDRFFTATQALHHALQPLIKHLRDPSTNRAAPKALI